MEEKFKEAMSYYDSGNYKKAISLLTPLADSGHVESCCKLGFIYSIGFGIRKNYKKAFNLLDFASSKNHAGAKYLLGEFYQWGIYVKKDLNKAIEYYEQSANQNYATAYADLAYVYQDLNDYQKAIYWLNKGCEINDIRCQMDMASCLKSGKGVGKNLDSACLFYQKAINNLECPEYEYLKLDNEQRRKNAMRHLARIYCDSKDKSIAKQGICTLYDLAKDDQFDYQTRTQVELFRIYRLHDYWKDSNKAFYWAKKASEKDDWSLFYTASHYLDGFGTEKNYDKAFEIFLNLSKKDHLCTQAKIELAKMYCEEEYGKQDLKKAFHIYDDLIKNNKKNIPSWRLPEIYAKYAELWQTGHCDFNNPDKYKAKEYFEKAYKLGYKDCKYALDSILLELGLNENDNELILFADKILKNKPNNTQIKKLVEQKIQECLGEYYSVISKEIRTYFIDAISNYIFNYSCGKTEYKKFDFSNVVLSLSKGLEGILSKIFFEGYIKFLQKNKIKASEFSNSKSRLIKLVCNNGIFDYEYINPEKDTGAFTLGSLYYIYDMKTNKKSNECKYEMNEHMLDYLNDIWTIQHNDNTINNESIIECALSISENVKNIAFQVRNPSAHRSITKHWVAESLANYLLLKDNFVCEILSHLKPSALKLLK